MRSLTLRRLAGAWSTALLLALCSCTSVRWESSDGTTHELGLIVYSIQDRGAARKVRRMALGADLRLSGPAAGYSLGFYGDERVTPALVVSSTPDELAESVARYLEAGPSQPLSRKRYGVLYYSDGVSANATHVETLQVGVGVAVNSPAGILQAGIGHSTHYSGPGPSQSFVHILSAGIESSRNWDARAWRLAPHAR